MGEAVEHSETDEGLTYNSALNFALPLIRHGCAVPPSPKGEGKKRANYTVSTTGRIIGLRFVVLYKYPARLLLILPLMPCTSAMRWAEQ